MCDCAYPEFYSESAHRSRKERRCQECRGVIHMGERYHVISGKWEGDFTAHSRCSSCAGLSRLVEAEDRKMADSDMCCILFGDLHPDIQQREADYGGRYAELAIYSHMILAARGVIINPSYKAEENEILPPWA